MYTAADGTHWRVDRRTWRQADDDLFESSSASSPSYSASSPLHASSPAAPAADYYSSSSSYLPTTTSPPRVPPGLSGTSGTPPRAAMPPAQRFVGAERSERRATLATRTDAPRRSASVLLMRGVQQTSPAALAAMDVGLRAKLPPAVGEAVAAALHEEAARLRRITPAEAALLTPPILRTLAPAAAAAIPEELVAAMTPEAQRAVDGARVRQEFRGRGVAGVPLARLTPSVLASFPPSAAEEAARDVAYAVELVRAAADDEVERVERLLDTLPAAAVDAIPLRLRLLMTDAAAARLVERLAEARTAVASLTPAATAAFSLAVAATVAPSAVSAMTPRARAALSLEAQDQLAHAAEASRRLFELEGMRLPASALAAATPARLLATVPAAALATLPLHALRSVIARLDAASVGSVPPATLAAVPPAALAALPSAALPGLSAEQLAALSAESLATFPAAAQGQLSAPALAAALDSVAVRGLSRALAQAPAMTLARRFVAGCEGGYLDLAAFEHVLLGCFADPDAALAVSGMEQAVRDAFGAACPKKPPHGWGGGAAVASAPLTIAWLIERGVSARGLTRSIFELFDVDRDGALRASELRAGVSTLVETQLDEGGFAHLFGTLSADGVAPVDFVSFRAWLLDVCGRDGESALRVQARSASVRELINALRATGLEVALHSWVIGCGAYTTITAAQFGRTPPLAVAQKLELGLVDAAQALATIFAMLDVSGTADESGVPIRNLVGGLAAMCGSTLQELERALRTVFVEGNLTLEETAQLLRSLFVVSARLSPDTRLCDVSLDALVDCAEQLARLCFWKPDGLPSPRALDVAAVCRFLRACTEGGTGGFEGMLAQTRTPPPDLPRRRIAPEKARSEDVGAGMSGKQLLVQMMSTTSESVRTNIAGEKESASQSAAAASFAALPAPPPAAAAPLAASDALERARTVAQVVEPESKRIADDTKWLNFGRASAAAVESKSPALRDSVATTELTLAEETKSSGSNETPSQENGDRALGALAVSVGTAAVGVAEEAQSVDTAVGTTEDMPLVGAAEDTPLVEVKDDVVEAEEETAETVDQDEGGVPESTAAVAVTAPANHPLPVVKKKKKKLTPPVAPAGPPPGASLDVKKKKKKTKKKKKKKSDAASTPAPSPPSAAPPPLKKKKKKKKSTKTTTTTEMEEKVVRVSLVPVAPVEAPPLERSRVVSAKKMSKVLRKSRIPPAGEPSIGHGVPSRPSTAPGTPGVLTYRDQLVALWSKHAPSKVAKVDKILTKHRGKEQAFINKQRVKFAKKNARGGSVAELPPSQAKRDSGWEGLGTVTREEATAVVDPGPPSKPPPTRSPSMPAKEDEAEKADQVEKSEPVDEDDEEEEEGFPVEEAVEEAVPRGGEKEEEANVEKPEPADEDDEEEEEEEGFPVDEAVEEAMPAAAPAAASAATVDSATPKAAPVQRDAAKKREPRVPRVIKRTPPKRLSAVERARQAKEAAHAAAEAGAEKKAVGLEAVAEEEEQEEEAVKEAGAPASALERGQKLMEEQEAEKKAAAAAKPKGRGSARKLPPGRGRGLPSGAKPSRKPPGKRAPGSGPPGSRSGGPPGRGRPSGAKPSRKPPGSAKPSGPPGKRRPPTSGSAKSGRGPPGKKKAGPPGRGVSKKAGAPGRKSLGAPG